MIGDSHDILRLGLKESNLVLRSLRPEAIVDRCSLGVLKNVLNFTRKTPVLESLFNKAAGLRLATLLKRDSNTGVSCKV